MPWHRVIPRPLAGVSRQDSKRPQIATTITADRAHDRSREWLYELVPAAPMPTVDLSISLKSRFLSRRALNCLNRMLSRTARKVTGISGALVIALFPFALVVPKHIGDLLFPIMFPMWIMTPVAAFSYLRYDVARLLVRTYDFWFFSFINTATYAALALSVGGARAAIVAFAWFGIQPNVIADANLGAVKTWVTLNVTGIIAHMIIWSCITFNFVTNMRDVAVFRYGAHELPARAFVCSGLITIMAILARNVHRRRKALAKRVNLRMIECVSYRTNLSFARYTPPVRAPRPSKLHIEPSPSAVRGAREASSAPNYIKTMQYVKKLGVLDAQRTLLPRIATVVLPHSFSTAFHVFGVMAVVLSVAAPFSDTYAVERETYVPIVSITALLMTTSYCGAFVAHCQRELFRTLCTSFDFVFLSLQLSVTYASVCDFFFWSAGGLVQVATSWIWIHWLMCLDAVPPVARSRLGLHRRFCLVIFLFSIASYVGVIYLLVFAGGGTRVIPDRVLWESRAFGELVQFRLVPFFYNCFGTAFALVLRLLWRAVVNGPDVLLVLDGAVVYENYLYSVRPRPASRRWGSIKRVRMQSRPHSEAVAPYATTRESHMMENAWGSAMRVEPQTRSFWEPKPS